MVMCLMPSGSGALHGIADTARGDVRKVSVTGEDELALTESFDGLPEESRGWRTQRHPVHLAILGTAPWNGHGR